VALRLLAPQRGLFATVRSKSKNKSKSLVLLSSLPQHRQFKGEHTPGILKVLLPPRQSRGISLLELAWHGKAHRITHAPWRAWVEAGWESRLWPLRCTPF
jgi:hypothetical protein